ncbi:MAG: DUF531 domain-containing protein [Thermococci archaeon]|nr:DUF531 domain-containing protein [Thermococci archaeon]
MLTIALQNTYDRRRLHTAHLRAIARAAPVAYSCGFHLALVDFPLEGKPSEVAEKVSESTTIGGGGRYLLELVRTGRFHILSGERGFPPQFGTVVVTTSKPWEGRAVKPIEIAERALEGESFIMLVGLGRHGLPKETFKSARLHMDVTERGVSLETCTAIGMIPCKIRTLMEALKWRNGRKTSHGSSWP